MVVDVPDRSEVLGEKHSLFLVRDKPKSVGVVMPVRHLALSSRLTFIFGKKKRNLDGDTKTGRMTGVSTKSKISWAHAHG